MTPCFIVHIVSMTENEPVRDVDFTNSRLAAVVFRDFAGVKTNTTGSSRHLDGAMRWLSRAQDRGGGAGVAASYSLVDGWQPPYPTFYDYATRRHQQQFHDRARRMIDWEIEQLPAGAVTSGLACRNDNPRASVFNAGQVILGYCRAFGETGDQRYLAAARRPGDWLVQAQGQAGAWRLETPVLRPRSTPMTHGLPGACLSCMPPTAKVGSRRQPSATWTGR